VVSHAITCTIGEYKMKLLLNKYRKALKRNNRNYAEQIEQVIMKYAESFEFTRRDAIIEQLTLASI
jgi:hypothetical protein